jgi:hypothetical protein
LVIPQRILVPRISLGYVHGFGERTPPATPSQNAPGRKRDARARAKSPSGRAPLPAGEEPTNSTKQSQPGQPEKAAPGASQLGVKAPGTADVTAPGKSTEPKAGEKP